MKKYIAITGGIGSGKSSVLAHLLELGYPVFSCDEIYREVIQSAAYVERVGKAFPQCIVENVIDRKILAKIVFENHEKLAKLNAISHPLIMDCLFEKMRNCDNQLVFAEVPLLFEGNFENKFDKVIVVLRDKEDRIQSIIKRDNLTRKEALGRIASQFDYDNGQERFESCNAILVKNDEEQDDLKLKIASIVKQIS
jgi:dephospho-CoA kinase